MNRNGAEKLRLEFARELGRQMVYFDELILRAEAAQQELDAFNFELMRDDVMHTRMAVMRRYWRDRWRLAAGSNRIKV